MTLRGTPKGVIILLRRKEEEEEEEKGKEKEEWVLLNSHFFVLFHVTIPFKVTEWKTTICERIYIF